MPESLTIEGVPEDVRDRLVAKAALRGQSLSDYLRSELIRLAGRPSVPDYWDRVERRVRGSGVRLSAEEILGLRGR